MGTFKNTPDAKVEAHGLDVDETQGVDSPAEPRYTDVVSRRPAVDKSEQEAPKSTAKKAPRSSGNAQPRNSR